MTFDFDGSGTVYLRKPEVAKRYTLTTRTLDRLMLHPDVSQRFPPPSLIMGRTPYWSVDALDRFDAEQEQLSRQREVKLFDDRYRSTPGQPKRGRRRQKQNE